MLFLSGGPCVSFCNCFFFLMGLTNLVLEGAVYLFARSCFQLVIGVGF